MKYGMFGKSWSLLAVANSVNRPKGFLHSTNTPPQIWDIFENKHLFDARDEEGEHSNRFHVAEMVAYLGNPPIELLRRSERAPLVFDEAGKRHLLFFTSPQDLTPLDFRQLEGQSTAPTTLA